MSFAHALGCFQEMWRGGQSSVDVFGGTIVWSSLGTSRIFTSSEDVKMRLVPRLSLEMHAPLEQNACKCRILALVYEEIEVKAPFSCNLHDTNYAPTHHKIVH